MAFSKQVARIFLRRNYSSLNSGCPSRCPPEPCPEPCPKYPIDPKKNPFVPDYEKAERSFKFFRFISFGICLPATLLFAAYLFQHMEHEEFKPPIPYDFMYEYAKPYCWGPNSLYHKDGVHWTPDDFREALEKRGPDEED